MLQRTIALRAAVLAGTALGANATQAATQVARAEASNVYDLPAQDLGETLLEIARRSRQEILFGSDAVRGLRAPAIAGSLTFSQAVRAALSGSRLVVEFRNGTAIVRPGNPTASRDDAGEAGNDAVTVTGTRIRGAAAASPTTIATRQQLEQAGIADLADFTRILPQNFAGGQNRGIPGGGEQGGQQNLNNSATLNLRGLGPDATLTLFNGHRLAYDSVNQGIDISAIPLAAIERVEVVTDGASALYGSDAVGGVANIILRREFDGLEATVRAGGSTDGGNEQQQASLVGGGRWASGGIMVALEASHASPITAGQRDYTRSVDSSLTLTNRNHQASLVVSGHQRIGPRTTVELDGFVTGRRSLLQNPYFAISDVRVNGLVSRPHVRSFAAAPAVRSELGPWQISLGGTISDSRTLLDTEIYASGVPRHSHLLYRNSLEGLEASTEGPLLKLPGGDARLAAGAGIRRIALHLRYQTLAGSERITTRDFTERRKVRYAFAELSLPLVSRDLEVPLVKRLTVSAALRRERWSGIGGETTPKLGLVYEPAKGLVLRGTWGKSFKIPTLRQVNDVQPAILIPGFYFTPPPQPSGSPVLLLSGSAPDLKPERATSWTASADWTPAFLPALTLQATYFDIDYRGRIAAPLTGVLTALNNPLFDDLITYNPSAAEVETLIASLPGGLDNQTGEPFEPAGVGAIVDTAIRNTERQRIRGVDLHAEYAVDLQSGGALLLSGAASYLTSKQQLAPGLPVLPLAGTVFHPPHWRGRAGAVWNGGWAGLSAFVSRVGPTRDTRYPDRARIGAFTTLDLSASFASTAESGALKDVELRLSALNLLNEKPEFVRSPFVSAAPFDSTNHSPVGRFLAVSVRKAWR
jgi:outer membrane receptor protein involved in Fe transport